MVSRKVKKKTAGTETKALPLIEQAVNLLRRSNAVALAEYYFGTLPFVLALLYFWSDMSGNPMAAWFCGPWAAGMALLFVWMKIWQVRFCRRLLCRLQKAEPEKWSLKRTFSTISRQTALHATGAVILPISLIIFLPMAWVYAFYQNLCVLDDGQDKSLITLFKDAKEQAVLWPAQNHMMLSIMSLFGLMVFFNLCLGLIMLPYLLKSILGIETVFTLSGSRLLNTTFWAVLFGLTYLCVDPIMKAVYVLRCFYGLSIKTGDDLKSALQPFLKVAALCLFMVMANLPQGIAYGDVTASARFQNSALNNQRYADQLDGQIEKVLEQRRYAWRLPRENVPEPPEDEGVIGSTLDWVGKQSRSFFKAIGDWLDDLFDKMDRADPDLEGLPSSETSDQRPLIRWLFYALGTGLLLLFIYGLIRWLKNSRPVSSGTVIEQESPDGIDLEDENVTAQDLPMDRWLSMAEDMISRKDFRRALRAVYLSILASLADYQRVKIARYKSNRDYARELERRAHAEPELQKIFGRCIQRFERSWYGMHHVDRQHVDQFMDNQKRILSLVQPIA